MKRLTRYAGLIAGASLLTAGLGGCGSESPMQGDGALYIFDHGVSRCVNVKSVTLMATHWTRYTDKTGQNFTASEPVAYYGGEQCR
jgi:urocanate hydratase